MFPLGIVNQGAEAPSWNKVLEMEFNSNFNDSTGRHSPVSYGAITTGGRLYANRDGRVFTDDYDGESADFDFTTKDFRISCDIQPISIGNDYVWMKSSGGKAKKEAKVPAMKKEASGLTAAQKKLPPGLQKAIAAKKGK